MRCNNCLEEYTHQNIFLYYHVDERRFIWCEWCWHYNEDDEGYISG
jgi:hypothetical protein